MVATVDTPDLVVVSRVKYLRSIELDNYQWIRVEATDVELYMPRVRGPAPPPARGASGRRGARPGPASAAVSTLLVASVRGNWIKKRGSTVQALVHDVTGISN